MASASPVFTDQFMGSSRNDVNKCFYLSFNERNAEFPSHKDQGEIARGFYSKSGAQFATCCLAVDGMLIWTTQPTVRDCDDVGISN